MKNIEEFYILERPIQTDIGVLYPFTVNEYPEMMEFMILLILDEQNIIVWLEAMSEQIEIFVPILESARQMTLFELIKLFDDIDYKGTIFNDLYELNNQYKELFEYCFREDVFLKVKSSEEFEYYRDLIITFNNIQYTKPNPNPEIERRNQLKRKLLEMKGETIDFESMITSIEVVEGRDIGSMTVYKFGKIFDRIAQFKNYDITVLYSMLDGRKIYPWYQTIQQTEPEEQYITEEQLEHARKTGELQEDL